MPTKTYEIFSNKEIVVPWNWDKNAVSIAKSVTWDENNTTILSARLLITVKPSEGYVKAWFELNTTEVAYFSWALGDNLVKSGSSDIIGVLLNGSNYFTAVPAKEFGNVNEVTFLISEQVVIDYEGEDPVAKPDFQKYLEYAAIGIGATAAVITIGGALTEEKK